MNDFKSTNQSIFDDNFQEHWIVDDGTYGLGKLFCVEEVSVDDDNVDQNEVEKIILE